MNRLLYYAFCLLLAAASGCAITNYGLITDNDQLSHGQSSNVVNTNGKAHFPLGKSLYAVVWPDGTDELIQFVDQRANGDRTLTTYNNFSTGDEPIFHDDLYCNPDWNGCAIFTAPDPEDPADDPFDGRLNANCSGARSLSMLVSTGRYSGECGRRPRVSLRERLDLLAMGAISSKWGREGLLYDWNAENATILLENEDGEVFRAPIMGQGTAWVSHSGPRPLAVVDATNALLGGSLGWYANWLDRHATDVTKLKVCYNGICTRLTIAGNVPPVSTGARVRANRDSRF